MTEKSKSACITTQTSILTTTGFNIACLVYLVALPFEVSEEKTKIKLFVDIYATGVQPQGLPIFNDILLQVL